MAVSLENVFASGQWEREDYRIAYLFMTVEYLSGDLSLSREHDDCLWMSIEDLAKAEVSPQLDDVRKKIVELMGR